MIRTILGAPFRLAHLIVRKSPLLATIGFFGATGYMTYDNIVQEGKHNKEMQEWGKTLFDERPAATEPEQPIPSDALDTSAYFQENSDEIIESKPIAPSVHSAPALGMG